MKKVFILTSIIAMTIGIGGCKTQKATATTKAEQSSVAVQANTSNSPVGKYWKLVEIYGKSVAEMTYLTKEPHLILKQEDNRASGYAGCNSFTGEYTLDEAASRIRFSKMATTRMMCIYDMTVEEEFLKVLEMTDNYTLVGDVLLLNKARMAPLARFEAVYLK